MNRLNTYKKKLKIIATIQARMGSERFPGKILKKISRYYLIDILIKRIKKSKLIDEIVVVTSNSRKEEPLIKFLSKNNIKFFRGSEKNVNLRLIRGAQKFKADIIVQLTADNPFVDPEIIDYMLDYFLKNKHKYDYLTNCGFYNFKNTNVPLGLNTQIFLLKDLKKNYKFCDNSELKEHPSLYFYSKGKSKYRLKNIILPFIKNKSLINKIRLTVDTEEDLKLVRIVFNKLYPKKGIYFSLNDILKFFKKNLFYSKINSHILQKKFI